MSTPTPKPTDPLLIEVPERIVTARLVLRCPRPGDGAALNAAVKASLPELQPWMPWAQQPPNPEESEALARGAHAKFLQRLDLVYSMWLHAGDGQETELVGGTGLHRLDWTVRRFEIGYWCHSAHRGRGLVSEAAVALNRLAFDQLNAHRVEIRMDARNLASQRVAQKAGFTLEGTLRGADHGVEGLPRDLHIYARVRGIEEPA